MSKVNNNTIIKVLHFKLLSIKICIDIKFIIKVLPLVQVEKIPLCNNYVVGLMNLNGKSITVIDLAIFLKLPRRNSYTVDMPIIICEYNGEQLAFLVDDTANLSDINLNELQRKTDFDTKNFPYLGISIEKHEQSLLLDMKKIFENCTLFAINRTKVKSELEASHV